jgi:hypothetical protein
MTDFDCAVRDLAWEAPDLEATKLGVRVDEDLEMRFFVLSDREMNRLFGEVGGISFYRDVFVRQNRPPHVRLHDALHESWHAAAHLAVAARRRLVKGESNLYILPMRGGLQFVPYGDKPITHRFLNEAATDILAHRAAVAARDNLSSPHLPPSVLAQAADYWSYASATCLVVGLCERLTETFSDPSRALRQLLIDYMTGSNKFLSALRRHEPRAVKLLAHAEPDLVTARALAEQLGYGEVVATLKPQ